MSAFIHLRIANKLALAFGAMLIITVALGVTAITRLGAIESKSREISGTWAPALTQLAQSAEAQGDLRELIQQRAERANETAAAAESLYGEARWQIMVTLLAACALGVAITWTTARSISNPLDQVIAIFQRISAGQLDNLIDTERGDEIGRLLAKLADMQSQLKQQIETERAVAAANTRVRQSLDKVSTCVVLADTANQVIYVNDIAQATFERRQAEIRKTLPSFDVQRLCEGTLDALTVDPGQQQQILATLSGTHVEERIFGGCTFRVVVNPVLDAHGERIGTVLEWTDRTQEVAVETEMQTMLAAVAGGDLTRRLSLAGKAGFFEIMSSGVNRLTDSLVDIVSRLQLVASEVYRGSEEISAGNTALSQRTEEQSSSLEETASSMEQMTSTVKQNADNAEQASELASAARGLAEKGGNVASRAVDAMTDISSASRRIVDIIGVINEIAFQTNLLALNAAVEAARAGEQGRGFAIVANEVRNLAGRSAAAAKEIKALIEDSAVKVRGGAELVTESGQSLAQIVVAVKKVSDIVAEIAAASREQSTGIEQVGKAVMQIDEITQQNAALVEEATAASQTLAQQAQSLSQIMARYRLPRGESQAQPAYDEHEPIELRLAS